MKAVTKLDHQNTLKEIEQNQAMLQQSIDESRKLAKKTQSLLDKHRKEIGEA